MKLIENEAINPKDYDLVVCVKGRNAKVFDDGKEITSSVKKYELSQEAGEYAELTIKKCIKSGVKQSAGSISFELSKEDN